MIDRYSREEMKNIWELNSKFDYYLKVEIAVCEAYAELGEFPKEDVLKNTNCEILKPFFVEPNS